MVATKITKEAQKMEAREPARKTLGYVRVSTDRQELERQRWLVEQWATLNGCSVDAWLEDDGISGRAEAVKGKSAAKGADMAYYAALCLDDYLASIERPGFLTLLQAVKDGQYSRVVVAALDRLSRDAIELLLFERKLGVCGCELVAVDQGAGAVSTKTPSGFLMYFMKAGWAEMECRTTSDRTAGALAAKKAAGVVLGRPPAGWCKEEGSAVFRPDPAKWPTMLALVDLKEGGATNEEVGQVLGMSEKVVRTWWKSWGRRADSGFAVTPEECQWQGMAGGAKTVNGRFRSICGGGGGGEGGNLTSENTNEEPEHE